MPPRTRKTSAAKKADVSQVDETVENQENPPGFPVNERESTDTTAEPEVPKMAAANDVDETVENQENPVTSDVERESTDTAVDDKAATKAWDTLAPANEVDETVENQMNPGINMVDRNPEPVVHEDSAGIRYDVSKPYPELMDTPEDDETQVRRAQRRQNEAAMNAKELVDSDEDSDHKHIKITFVEGGLSAAGRVWRKGEVLTLEDTEDSRNSHKDTNGDVWYEQSASEQEKRYGKVFFEKE